MAKIDTIELHLETGEKSGAGTDGDVYLGLCGREFYIDTEKDDFEAGSGRVYILGDGANILHPDLNDPREHGLFTQNVALFPVYIRFQPKSRDDRWLLDRADVRFNGSIHIDWDTSPYIPIGGPGLWLGVHAGLCAHLFNLSHEAPPGGPAGAR